MPFNVQNVVAALDDAEQQIRNHDYEQAEAHCATLLEKLSLAIEALYATDKGRSEYGSTDPAVETWLQMISPIRQAYREVRRGDMDSALASLDRARQVFKDSGYYPQSHDTAGRDQKPESPKG